MLTRWESGTITLGPQNLVESFECYFIVQLLAFSLSLPLPAYRKINAMHYY